MLRRASGWRQAGGRWWLFCRAAKLWTDSEVYSLSPQAFGITFQLSPKDSAVPEPFLLGNAADFRLFTTCIAHGSYGNLA